MRVISRKAFRQFWENHPESEQALTEFYGKLKRCNPANIAELRQTFPSADLVGHCMVFNVGGNNFRVIIHVDFEIQGAWIRFVLSHAEYSKGRWKTDC